MESSPQNFLVSNGISLCKEAPVCASSPHPLLITFRNPAGDLLDLVKSVIQINTRTRSTINTAAHANSATVIKLFSLYAAIRATKNPAAPEMMLSVAFRMAGKVMAARQAYGT